MKLNLKDALKGVVIPVASIVASIIVAYLTATYAVNRELANGKARLIDITYRYTLNVVNVIDHKKGEVRKDPLAKELYVKELEVIVNDLDKLLGNAYVERLILEHPRISKLMVILRRELAEGKKESASEFGLNPTSLTEVFDLMDVVRKDLGKNSKTAEGFEAEVLEAERILRPVSLPN
jgi:hypothetical protein